MYALYGVDKILLFDYWSEQNTVYIYVANIAILNVFVPIFNAHYIAMLK